MKPFRSFYETAILHKGSSEAVSALLPRVLSSEQISSLGDAELLSTLCLRVFQAGLKHDLVASKWPAFEVEFNGFDPFACAMMSDEAIERAMMNSALIRHMRKLQSIRVNAQMVLQFARDHGSFAQFLARWPVENIVGLWRELKKNGAQLGGMSAARFLRMAGVDTFLLTGDVIAVLKSEGVVSKEPTSMKELNAVQAAFNQWHQESGLPMSHMSRILSMTSLTSL